MEEFQAFLSIDLILILTYRYPFYIPLEFSCWILYTDIILFQFCEHTYHWELSLINWTRWFNDAGFKV